ncbi:MAG: C39 family peptidase, partial [Candidatus Moranbacteria bacterium]|nr:C39 family peptidase [Candidatus Moranbacteria bacterium]
MKKRYLLVIIFVFTVLGGGCILVVLKTGFTMRTGAPVNFQNADIPETTSDPQPIETAPSGQALPENSADKLIRYRVPFVVQAPTANWDDLVFQNACEEASVIMAMGWVNGTESISSSDAQKQISDIDDFEMETFGYSYDTDVFDVKRIFEQYFKYNNVSIQENISIDDIKRELQAGNLVLVPAFGQALGNPNYTYPGPVVHMLVITGYDPAAREFITNDPGTRRGGGYRYDGNVLMDAVWQYPSGQDVPSVPLGSLKK